MDPFCTGSLADGKPISSSQKMALICQTTLECPNTAGLISIQGNHAGPGQLTPQRSVG